MNYFIAAFKKYAVFNGRARRSEYWYFFLFNIIISFVLGFIGGAMGNAYLQVIWALATLIPNIAVGVRRMHDVNKSGWFILIPIYSLILACTPGTTGPNDYGEDPKNPEFEEFLQTPE
ncbi:DUF805 domain-containing protein [Flavitalea sp. BT771]|uniref:DUF805 domain-containing protein n=1 Tax=Flavitalea sp. BT771 TaxID=3063329 RepID=UPI0026E32F5C|nr:DUF805 domain-containing protein [Flavitalea sp. BT771]MDO6429569.1 DUF805 domain-containing protein [Flavitalea sp. BT771]MDV6218303.1 DUF805 domain-containing protein [Flavitalea sp. BT771]